MYMRRANARRRYNVMSSLIGWAHTQYDPYIVMTKFGSRILNQRDTPVYIFTVEQVVQLPLHYVKPFHNDLRQRVYPRFSGLLRAWCDVSSMRSMRTAARSPCYG